MSKSPWYVESELKEVIENLILQTYLHKRDFEKADNPSKAQLWIALALISRKLEEVKERLMKIENSLKKLKESENKKSNKKRRRKK